MRILVMDVGGTAIKSAIIDDTGKLSDVCTTSSDKNVEVRMEKVIHIAGEYSDFDVLSASMRGQIDDKAKTMLFRYNKAAGEDAQAYPAGEILGKALGRPAFILNDANAAALGEAHLGAGRAHKDFLCLTYGTGVGGAIIQNGRLFTGTRGIAGEMGHMVTHKGGRLCGCGHRGCYEQYASTTALLDSARKFRPELENAKEIFNEAENDLRLRRVITAWEDEITEGLLTLPYIFNPCAIILGGGVMQEEVLLADIKKRFFKRVIPTFSDVDILAAELGNKAGMMGAAIYAKQRLNEI